MRLKIACCIVNQGIINHAQKYVVLAFEKLTNCYTKLCSAHIKGNGLNDEVDSALIKSSFS